MSFESLFSTISAYKSISEQAKEALVSTFRVKELPKDHYLAKSGKVCQHLYFLQKGCLRAYYYTKDKEITSWFAFENSFVTSYHSFISQKPAMENIVLLEDSQLLEVSHEELHALYQRFHELETLGRLINEQYYAKLEERVVSRQFKSAKQIYDLLLTNSPNLLQRVPLGYIASYLGIAQETLSRVRGKI
jgi:CRP-like cAMP-binding protein